MAFVTIDDKDGQAELTCFDSVYEHYKEQMIAGGVLVFDVELSKDDYSGRARAIVHRISDLDEIRCQQIKSMIVRWHVNSRTNQLITALKELLEPHIGGNCPVIVEYHNEKAKCKLQLNQAWNVTPNKQLEERLKGTELEAFLIR